MTTWTKLTPAGPGAPLQTHPRYTCSPTQANVILPNDIGLKPRDRVSVYSDGNGRVAYELDPEGAYRVRRFNAKCTTVIIPASIRKNLPTGTHDIDLSAEGKRLICDLRGRSGIRIAAE